MSIRADAARATAGRILEAAIALAEERGSVDAPLAEVATRAGVSVQTLLRHFGSREGLLDAAMRHAATQVVQERQAPVGDVAAAVRILVDHYERRGRASLGFLANEDRDPRVRAITDLGRATHRAWVRQVFTPADDVQTDLLVIATDVYAWKLLRLDRQLGRRQVEARLRHLITAILKGSTP